MLETNPLLIYSAIALAGFLTGLAKGGLGGMMGALITTMMAQVLPINIVIGAMLPIFIIGDIFAVAFHWGNWNKKLVIALLPGAVFGVTLGTYVITNISSSALRTGLGIIVLIFITYRLIERKITSHITYQSKIWHAPLAGTITGFTSALAHAGGPPIAIFLLMNDLVPSVFVATSALFFAIVNWIKVPYYYYAGLFDFHFLLKIAWLAPTVPIGAWIGKWLTHRVNKVVFERILLILLTISAFMLLVKD